MSYEEMEQVWNGQGTPTVDHEQAQEWIRRNRRSYLATTAWVTLSVMIGVGILTLKLAAIYFDPERTVWNSSLDLCVGVFVFLAGIYGLKQYVRQRREFEALGEDPVRCLDALISATRREIRDVRQSGPIVFLLVLALLGMAQWQSVVAGFATVGEAMGILVMAVALLLVSGVLLYHRSSAFLKPRLEGLKDAREIIVCAIGPVEK